MDAPHYDEAVAILRSESGDATSVDNITTIIDEIGHFYVDVSEDDIDHAWTVSKWYKLLLQYIGTPPQLKECFR